MGRLAVICAVLTVADSLAVTSYAPQAASLLHHDVLLCCEFSHPEPIALSDIGVIWNVKRGSSGQPVYKFDGHNATAERSGSSIDFTSLPMGNASLHLPNLTLEDAGEYTCTVFVSTHAGKATLLLKVAAQPFMLLSPMNPSLMFGESKTFLCDLTGFYPEDLEISWFKRSQDGELGLSENICTGIPVLEDNGTFRVSSQISAAFSEDDAGVFLICEVRHESLRSPLRSSSTVYLMARGEAQGSTAATVSIVVCTVLLAIIFGILYQRFLAKVPPLMSQLIIPELNSAGEKMVALCNISGFRPRTIDICWYIDKSIKEAGAETSGKEPLLSAADITGQASHSVSKQGSVFNMTSELSYTPSVQDHGAKMVCEVKHKALRGVKRLERPIYVIARPNKMYITSSPLVPRAGEKLALSCIVEKFYPKPISLSWVKNRSALTNVTQYGPFPCDNDYYSVWSQVEFILSEKDDGAIFICQISHNSLGSPEEVSFEINLKGMPPEVQYISADPPDPGVGMETRLSCMLQNFFPMDIEVIWFKNGVQQDLGVYNSPCVQSSRGLYLMCTMLKLIAQAGDHESVFTCRVQHVALKSCQERTYTLTLTGSSDLSGSANRI